MSRAYRIRVAESERRYIVVQDRVCTDIELLPILPKERLGEILAAELVERGFDVADGRARRKDGDVELEVELETGRVSARLEAGADVEQSASTTLRTYDRSQLDEGEEKEIRDKLRSEVSDKLAADEEQMQRDVTAKLESKLRDVQREVDEVSNRVAGAALKEKAAQLGEIIELHEDETGSMTIKVKV